MKDPCIMCAADESVRRGFTAANVTCALLVRAVAAPLSERGTADLLNAIVQALCPEHRNEYATAVVRLAAKAAGV